MIAVQKMKYFKQIHVLKSKEKC